MFDVLTIGSATIDLFIRSQKKVSSVKLGEKVLIDKLDFETGGGGTNSAVSLSRMGLNVGFIGKLGSDHNRDLILKELDKEHVFVLNKKYSNEKTSLSVILTSNLENDRIIYTHKGASNDLTIKDLNYRELNSKWLYSASMMGHSLKTLVKIFEHAKKKNIQILFNPSEYMIENEKKQVLSLVKKTDCLILNSLEAKLLTNKSKNKKELCLLLSKLGPKIVVVTDGEKEITAYSENKFFILKPKKVKAVSTAGAGDAFASGFLAGLIKKENIFFALKIGLINAQSVIQHFGSKNGLLNYKEAEKSC